MNQSVKRTGVLAPFGLPPLDDHALANKVAELTLPEPDHKRAVLLTVGLIPGKFGLLSRPDRDWLTKLALNAGVLPRLHRRPPGQKCLYAQDPYSDRDSEALAKVLKNIVAKMVPSLGGQLPTPPPRRNW